MSSKSVLYCSVILGIIISACPPASAVEDGIDLTEELKKSLVYLNISAYVYSQMQPWKSADIASKAGFGCAVGPYEILTTARNASNAAMIKARRHGQNEFIPAEVKVIDYESNLCLLQLDKEAAGGPLKPLTFSEKYDKGVPLQSYWLTAAGNLTNGRGYLDKAKVYSSQTSYAQFINFVVANTSNITSAARLYCMGEKPIGIACWANIDTKQVGIIPAMTINNFLADARNGQYAGFGTAGFATRALLDPTLRNWLKMPEDMKKGVYIPKVYNLGTGSNILKQGDVILAIDGQSLNAYGRFEHEQFDRISYYHLISGHSVKDEITFDVWRDGERLELKTTVQNFKASEMLVPYYEYSMQPEYIVTGGFVFQRLTRNFLQTWGDDWGGKVPPHLYHYYRDLAFSPTDERSDIVILNYTLPTNINLGYHGLGRMVVSKFNGREISSLAEILEAQKLNPESKYDVVEFEQDYPTVVIPRTELPFADVNIAQTYGVGKLVNIKQ
ncbi:MAG: PDZ domain-containing protein [Planctomycetota bacterium]|jgi:hypothetical protein